MEYKHIDDYYPRPEEGQSPIDQAVQGQLEFSRVVLDQARASAFVEEFAEDNGLTLSRSRNLGGLNVDFHDTRLRIKNKEPGNEVVAPSVIEMQSRAVLRTQDGQSFAGYTENEYTYWRTGLDDRLQQRVVALHMPERVSPVFETVSINRYVLDRFGDLTYGNVIFNDREVTRGLGIKPRRGSCLFNFYS
jgi:hypothetical protein